MERKSRNLGGGVGSYTDCLTQLGNLPEGVTTLHKLKEQEGTEQAKQIVAISDRAALQGSDLRE